MVVPFIGPYTGLVRGTTINNPYRAETLRGKDKILEGLYEILNSFR